MSRRLILLVCLVLSLMTFSACKREAAPTTASAPAPSQPAGYIIDPSLGMPPALWRMTANEVQAALGPAEHIDSMLDGTVLLLDYPSKGFTLTVPREEGLLWITGQTADGFPSGKAASFRGKTSEGIGLGATEDAIIAAYGQPTTRVTDGSATRLTYSGILIKIFTLSDGRLVQLKFCAPGLAVFPNTPDPASTASAL
jgi:hypothetical protein